MIRRRRGLRAPITGVFCCAGLTVCGPASFGQTHINMEAVATQIVWGDARVCFVGDSITTDNSTHSNLPYGIQRTWKPAQWVARYGRPNSGPPAWAMFNNADTFFYPQPQLRTPSWYFFSQHSAISPNLAWDWLFNADMPDWGPMLLRSSPWAPEQYAKGNWMAGVPVMARGVYFRAAPPVKMVPSLRLRGMRGGQIVAEQIAPMLAPGPSGVTAQSVDCGAGFGNPTLEWTSSPGVDETGTYAHLMGVGFYRHDGQGNPLAGFGLMQIGEGGWTTSDHLVSWRCSDAALAQFLGASLQPNIFMIMLGANLTQQEASSLGDANPAIFRANIEAIIDRLSVAAATYGVAAPRFVVVSNYALEWPTVVEETRSVALKQIAMQRPNVGFIDLWAIAGDYPSIVAAGYLGDAAHPNVNGAVYFANLLWEQIEDAATCYANCDGSTAIPALNVADFGCFLQKFAAGEPYANCDGSTMAPVLNVADFGCFLQAFAAGCGR